MLQEILTIGDKIEIKPLKPNGEPAFTARTFVSQLIEFEDVNVLNIAVPIVFGRPVLLTVGGNYRLCFYTEKGLFQCNCVVQSNRKEEKMISSIVLVTTDLEKLQRRQYYRIECIHEIEYYILSFEEEQMEKKIRMDDFHSDEERNEYKKMYSQIDRKWVRASIVDLSGGGARFISDKAQEKGQKLRIRMELVLGDAFHKMTFYSRIISSEKNENKSGVYENRVEFYDISSKDREDLIKYIFEQDRRI